MTETPNEVNKKPEKKKVKYEYYRRFHKWRKGEHWVSSIDDVLITKRDYERNERKSKKDENNAFFGSLKGDYISCERRTIGMGEKEVLYHNRIIDEYEKFLPSEDEIGFIIFKNDQDYNDVEARKAWAVPHLKASSPASLSAKEISKRIGKGDL